MQKFRSSALLLSSAFSLTLLTGCPNAGTQPALPETGTSPSPVASMPTASASTEPVASVAPGASVAPATTPSTSPLVSTTVRGKVYDEDGAISSSGKVSVKSLNAANPFESTVDIMSGSYVVNDVPAGVQLQISTSRTGWTSRTRVETLLPLSSTQGNVVNFGGADQTDTEGEAYFISKYPEIVSAEANRNDGSKLTYVIRLSEPLDEANRRRFENALAITAPNPNGGFITIRSNSTFLDDRVRPSLSWDAAGTTLTYEFAVPLMAKSSGELKYSLTIVRGLNDELIKDTDGNVLGRIAPDPASSYLEAFKLTSPLVSAIKTPDERWKAAHSGSADFDVPEDKKKPALVSVSGGPIDETGASRYRFSLTFSEPLRVFPEATGFDAGVLNKANFFFAYGDKSLDGTDITVAAGTVTDAASALAAMDSNAVFQFGAAGADSVVSFSNTDPKVVHVTVDRDRVPPKAAFVKVRVEGVKDPAGNIISSGNKDTTAQTADNIKSGAL